MADRRSSSNDDKIIGVGALSRVPDVDDDGDLQAKRDGRSVTQAACDSFIAFKQNFPTDSIDSMYDYLLRHCSVLEDLRGTKQRDPIVNHLLRSAQLLVIAEASRVQARSIEELKKKLHLTGWLYRMLDMDASDPSSPRAVAYSAYHDLIGL